MEEVGNAAWNFGLAALVLGAVVALLVHALDDLVLRAAGNRGVVRSWLEKRRRNAGRQGFNGSGERNLPEVKALERELIAYAMAGDHQAFYNLHYAQLCAQISASLQISLEHSADSDLVHITTAPPSEARPRMPLAVESETRSYFLDRNIDELQIRLKRFWMANEYYMSLLISSGIFGLLWLYGGSLAGRVLGAPLYVSVALTAGLLAPTLRRVIERVTLTNV